SDLPRHGALERPRARRRLPRPARAEALATSRGVTGLTSPRGAAALRARPAQHDVVRRHAVAEPCRQLPQRAFEPLVLERHDVSAAVADEVMVMLAVGVGGLVARDTSADVDALHEPERGEDVEHPVDARDPHAAPAAPQAVEDLLRAHAAVLLAEQLHDGSPR